MASKRNIYEVNISIFSHYFTQNQAGADQYGQKHIYVNIVELCFSTKNIIYDKYNKYIDIYLHPFIL